MSSGSVKCNTITRQDVDQVQDLIERCIMLYMSPKEIVSTLQEKAKIEPAFTKTVWQKLNEQNPEFFKAYYTRLALKQQIEKFNELLEKQKQLMDSQQANVVSLPSSNESNIPSIPENPASSYVPVQTSQGLNSKNLQHGVESNSSNVSNNKGSSFGMVGMSAHGNIPNMTFTQNSNIGMQQGVNRGMTISKPGYSSSSSHMFGADGKVGNASTTPFNNVLNNSGSLFDMFAQGVPSMPYTHNTNMSVQQGINAGMNTSKPGYSSYSPHMFGAGGNVVNSSATSFTNVESSSRSMIDAVLDHSHPTSSIMSRKFSFPNVSDLFPMGFETLGNFYGSPFIDLDDNNSPQTGEHRNNDKPNFQN